MVEPKAFQDALLAYHARPCDPEAEAVRAAVLEQVAAMLDNKADDYGMEHGHVDGETGAVEFGRGWRGEVKEDHYNDLRELADEVRGMKRAAGVAACIPTLPMSEVSGVVFVFHPEDPMLQLLPEGTHVVLQRRIPTPKDGVAVPAPLSDERILHLWDAHVAYETGASVKQQPLGDKDKIAFARAVLAAGVEGKTNG